VAQEDQVGALGHLGVGGHNLAADLGGQRAGAVGEHVGAHHGPAPAEREAARHVPRADEADLHCGGTLHGARRAAGVSSG
jgi:hypothetical protein